jgi:hypothetical protein
VVEANVTDHPQPGGAPASSSEGDQSTNLHPIEPPDGSGGGDFRWSPRATVLISLGAGLALWALIAWGLAGFR